MLVQPFSELAMSTWDAKMPKTLGVDPNDEQKKSLNAFGDNPIKEVWSESLRDYTPRSR